MGFFQGLSKCFRQGLVKVFNCLRVWGCKVPGVKASGARFLP